MQPFSWVPVYQEIARKLLGYRNRQDELIKMISEMHEDGLVVINLKDKDKNNKTIKLTVMDPFTYFANFNRAIKNENRVEILKVILKKLNLDSEIPSDFSGIPTVNNQNSWFFEYQKDRKDSDIDLLWDLFEQAVAGNIKEETFMSVLKIRNIRYKITMGLYWINADKYLNLDKMNRNFLEKNGVIVKEPLNYENYVNCMEQTRKLFNVPFYRLSDEAWNTGKTEPEINEVKNEEDENIIRVWLISPGRGGKYWDEFYHQGIIAIGWDHLGDLTQYDNRNEIADAIKEFENVPDSSKKNDAAGCFAFCNDIQIGDKIFAKIGSNKIIGYGIVTSEYLFDNTRSKYKHVRKVDWKVKGEWIVNDENKFAFKTLTEVTRYKDFIGYLNTLIKNTSVITNDDVKYWWLNANPKIWDINSQSIGTRQTYTSYNSKGNKRRIYQYFHEVKPGDILIGYVASPIRQIVALCKVTRELSLTKNGEEFEFEKIEQFVEPVSFKELQSIPDLEDCEPLINNQGSLFRLKPEEYEIIRSVIDQKNEASEPQVNYYSIEEMQSETGFSKNVIQDWVKAVERKKQAVFYGPPGTGKTYLVQRLARHIVGGKNGFIECIQFHPAYSYEEFIQGIRPETDEKGNLQYNLKPGRFLEFCARAKTRSEDDICVMIIDELNRADLAKVFGELMYLLEYREQDMHLSGGMRFSIPKNVRILGTMNTADRSIALVDFALRRRFAFIELIPEYEILNNFLLDQKFNAKGLVGILKELNTKINDKNFYIGISFFMIESLGSKLEQIWKMEIETYIEEYFFNQSDVVAEYRWDKIKEKIFT